MAIAAFPTQRGEPEQVILLHLTRPFTRYAVGKGSGYARQVELCTFLFNTLVEPCPFT